MPSFLSRVRLKVQNEPSAPSVPAVADPLAAFRSEDPIAGSNKTQPAVTRSRRLPLVALIVGGVLVLVGGVVAGLKFKLPIGSIEALSSPTGRLVVDTQPAGADVSLNGARRGTSPLTLDLAPGAYTLVVGRSGQTRTVPVQIAAGAEVSHYLEFAPEAAAAVARGHLAIATDPPGARISIDGEQIGRSPLTVKDLAVARHKVVVAGEYGTVERQVEIAAGSTTSVVFSLPTTPPATAGYLSIAAPFEVQAATDDEIIGSNASARIMVRAGRYDLTLKNEELGFSERRRVDIQVGQTTTVRLEVKAPVSVNARPWADVTIDGVPAGQTPLANFPVALGSHEVVFRHPSMGERRQTFVVTAKGPNRLSVDMTK
jgi:hypothetical protein